MGVAGWALPGGWGLKPGDARAAGEGDGAAECVLARARPLGFLLALVALLNALTVSAKSSVTSFVHADVSGGGRIIAWLRYVVKCRTFSKSDATRAGGFVPGVDKHAL